MLNSSRSRIDINRSIKADSVIYIHDFYYITNARLKLGKNQGNAKQHPEAELWLFENYHILIIQK